VPRNEIHNFFHLTRAAFCVSFPHFCGVVKS
jgi:hypothetical protein